MAGRKTEVLDGTGAATTTIYDNVYRPTETWQSNNTRVTTMYDQVGRTTQVKDELSHSTATAYDAVNRKTETVQPLGQRTTYSYDRASRMTLKIDALSHRTTTSYDKVDREKVRNYFDSTSSFSYDPVGNRTAMADVSGSYTYVYDNVNQLAGTSLEEVVNLKSTNLTISSYDYALNAVGNRTSARENGVDIINWLPDSLQQLQSDIYLASSGLTLSWTRRGGNEWE